MHNGRSKGCGIVEYADINGTNRAIKELNDLELMGRKIFVREDRERGGRRGQWRWSGGGREGGGRRIPGWVESAQRRRRFRRTEGECRQPERVHWQPRIQDNVAGA